VTALSYVVVERVDDRSGEPCTVLARVDDAGQFVEAEFVDDAAMLRRLDVEGFRAVWALLDVLLERAPEG